MIISTFQNQKDNLPARGEASWDQLVKALSVPRVSSCTVADCKRSECPGKETLAWSPAYWPIGAKRGNIGVEGVSVAVVDLDHLSDEDLLPILERLSPWRHILHASHSDKPGDRCLRAVLAIDRPVLAIEWRRFWRGLMTALELPGDEQVKDAARLYYTPSRPSDACQPAADGTGFAFESVDGDVLAVDEVLQFAPAELAGAPATESYEDFVVPEFAGAPEAEKMMAAAEVLADAWPTQGRHTMQLALAGALARAGWPAELIADFCAAVADIQQPGNADLPKRLTAARSSVEKVRGGVNVQGWPSLIEVIGEEPVARARALLGMDTIPRHDPDFVASIEEAAIAAAAPPTTSGAPLPIDLDAALRSTERKLSGRKDADSIRDAGYLKLVREGKFLTESHLPDADRKLALAMATLAVARSVPPGTTAEQIHSKLLPSAGFMAPDLDACVASAMRVAGTLPPILARRTSSTPSAAPGEAPLDEFVLETSGPRAGRPVAGAQHNFDIALARLEVSFRYDMFSRRKFIVRADEDPEVVADRHINGLMFEIERTYDFYPPKDKFYDYTTDIAHKNSFHPVLDYLDTIPTWDGVDRTSTWLIQFGGVEDSPYTRAVSRLFLVAAVRRVRQPGCKFDEMIILEGGQGTLKSSALKALCPDPEWFAEFKLDGDPKHFIEQSSGKWILEAAELKGMSNKEHADLKAQLSTTHDTARAAYAREPQTVARQSILAGTTNDSQYLRDPTGDRRYWPMRITRPFDVKGLIAVRDQLWAEAAQLDLEHPEENYIRLDPSLWAAATAQQDARKVDHPYQIMLDDALGGVVGRIAIQETWKLLKFDRTPTQAEQNQIMAAMAALGFERERKMVGGSRGYYYIRGTGPERDIVLSLAGDEHRGYTVRPRQVTAN